MREFPQEFTKADNLLELSNDNAKVTGLTGGRGAQVDSLAAPRAFATGRAAFEISGGRTTSDRGQTLAKGNHSFELGNLDVEIVTPATRYQAAVERQTRAEREREKHATKSGALPKDRKSQWNTKCKQISVEVVPVKEPDKPLVKVLHASAVTHIWNDFDPFRKAQEAVKTAK